MVIFLQFLALSNDKLFLAYYKPLFATNAENSEKRIVKD